MQGLNVLLVEDNDALRHVTAEVLTQHGFGVTALDCAEAVSEAMPLKTCDVAILDVNLPGEDGLSLARRLRFVAPALGIVLLTVRHQLQDRLQGYADGADVYLTKPTDPQELCAVVGALGQRLRLAKTSSSIDVCRLELETCSLFLGCNQTTLSPAEAKVLHAFVLAPNATLENWQMMELLGKPMNESSKGQLEVFVSRLRSKFVALGCDGRTLIALRGLGYRLNLSIVFA